MACLSLDPCAAPSSPSSPTQDIHATPVQTMFLLLGCKALCKPFHANDKSMARSVRSNVHVFRKTMHLYFAGRPVMTQTGFGGGGGAFWGCISLGGSMLAISKSICARITSAMSVLDTHIPLPPPAHYYCLHTFNCTCLHQC
jgi:hypothetical protein